MKEKTESLILGENLHLNFGTSDSFQIDQGKVCPASIVVEWAPLYSMQMFLHTLIVLVGLQTNF